MAIVRLSRNTRWEIDANAQRQFQTRREPLIKKLRDLLCTGDPQLTDAIAGAIRDLHGVSELQLEAVQPFLSREPHIRLVELNNVLIPYLAQTITLSRPIYMPVSARPTKLVSPRLAKWATALQRITTEMNELDEEERSFRVQLDKLLNTCVTYKQALDIWPQLASVTPPHILARHNAPQQRRSRNAPDVPALDVEKLNVSAVKNVIAVSVAGRKS
jgi:hypothetical protein